MSVGPLRRLSGIVGLLALAPIAITLLAHRIDVTTAAVRAASVLIMILLAGRLAEWGIRILAVSLERQTTAGTPDSAPGWDGHGADTRAGTKEQRRSPNLTADASEEVRSPV